MDLKFSKRRTLLRLLKQKTTWAGLAALLGAGVILGMTEDMWMIVFSIPMAIAGALLALYDEMEDEKEENNGEEVNDED